MARNPLENQLSNRNFLSPIGFKFSIAKTPKVEFYCNSARIPEITLGTAIQPSYLKDIDVPGDKLQYGDLSLRFLVDEEMENYMSIHNWLVGLGFPETAQQFKDLTTETNQNSNRFGERDMDLAFSDASLYILNSNYRTTAIIKFKDLFELPEIASEVNCRVKSSNKIPVFLYLECFNFIINCNLYLLYINIEISLRLNNLFR